MYTYGMHMYAYIFEPPLNRVSSKSCMDRSFASASHACIGALHPHHMRGLVKWRGPVTCSITAALKSPALANFRARLRFPKAKLN